MILILIFSTNSKLPYKSDNSQDTVKDKNIYVELKTLNNYGFKRMDVDENPLSSMTLRKGCFDLVVSALWPWEISYFVFEKYLNVAKIISFSCS